MSHKLRPKYTKKLKLLHFIKPLWNKNKNQMQEKNRQPAKPLKDGTIQSWVNSCSLRKSGRKFAKLTEIWRLNRTYEI